MADSFFMDDSLYIAVDLGAGSGRVFLCGLAAGELLLEEIRRFHYPPMRVEGHLRWDAPKIFDEIKTGLRAASDRARELGRAVRSVGVDSWGVDYGLIDADGHLVENPVCYRDERTQGAMEKVFARVSREEIFARTGIQFLNFNTLFQLYAHAQRGINAAAKRLLLIPDLINFFLTGEAVTEYTNATTTQMINAETGAWDFSLLERLNLPTHLLTNIVRAGASLGRLKPALADELNLEGAQVVAVATHDTASAVAGAPLEENQAYISSGTWSLVGVERTSALINSDVARRNFTNEGGAFKTFRFLKNVTGLWILEACRKEWSEHGIALDYDDLLREVASVEDYPALIFPDDARFFNPPSMLDAIAAQLHETGERASVEPPIIAKMIMDSLAFRYASALRDIERLTNRKLESVQIVGGGGRNDYLNQATANASGLPVTTGLNEATVVGSALVQAIAAGRFASLSDARRHVRDNVDLKRYKPRTSRSLEDAARRYAEIERRFVN
jgi:rhamnulokinase